METRVFELTLKDGWKFRVFCQNKSQIMRYYNIAYNIEGAKTEVVTNGLHTVKQFEQIAKTFKS